MTRRICLRIELPYKMYDFVEAWHTERENVMKILVLSDSHHAKRAMEAFTRAVKPDAVIHLGDYYEDGRWLWQNFPEIPFYQVPGNCDYYDYTYGPQEVLTQVLDGVKLYMTHGHRHDVKETLSFLLRDARASHADVVLYGHTHVPDCRQEEDGLWILNPGACGYVGATAGIIETAGGRVTSCRLIKESDLA